MNQSMLLTYLLFGAIQSMTSPHLPEPPVTAGWVALWNREMAVALTLARQVLAGWRTPLFHEAIL
jgi:hypothetical protein